MKLILGTEIRVESGLIYMSGLGGQVVVGGGQRVEHWHIINNLIQEGTIK